MFNTKRAASLLNPDWPEVKWNISGLFHNRVFVRIFVGVMENEKIAHVLNSFRGCPDLIWNGGHANANVPNYPDSAEFFKKLNDRGIGVYLTFSNTALEKKHLSDPDSNRLLECLDEACGLNGVIVAGDLISDYIRKKKPGLKQICSIVRSFVENPEGDIAWYKEMEKRFDRVAVHTDHIFDPELLDKLDRDKAEILVNEECAYKCPHRKRHHTLNSAYNLTGSREVMAELEKIRQNFCAGRIGVLSAAKNPGRVRSCFMKHNEVKTIYDMGFRNFKLSGRRKTINDLAWNVINFVFNPALAAPFSAIFAHKIDHNIRQEFQKLAQKEDVV